jgi:hypothetical protein
MQTPAAPHTADRPDQHPSVVIAVQDIRTSMCNAQRQGAGPPYSST